MSLTTRAHRPKTRRPRPSTLSARLTAAEKRLAELEGRLAAVEAENRRLGPLPIVMPRPWEEPAWPTPHWQNPIICTVELPSYGDGLPITASSEARVAATNGSKTQ